MAKIYVILQYIEKLGLNLIPHLPLFALSLKIVTLSTHIATNKTDNYILLQGTKYKN